MSETDALQVSAGTFIRFLFSTGTGYEIYNSRQSGYSDRHKNRRARSVSTNLSACCFHLRVTSIICQSCPQIVAEEEKKMGHYGAQRCVASCADTPLRRASEIKVKGRASYFKATSGKPSALHISGPSVL